MKAGRPADAPECDGIAGQWFETEADCNAVQGRADRPTRADTLAQTSAFQRLVVREFELVLFLSDPAQSGQVTGQALTADGGVTMVWTTADGR